MLRRRVCTIRGLEFWYGFVLRSHLRRLGRERREGEGRRRRRGEEGRGEGEEEG